MFGGVAPEREGGGGRLRERESRQDVCGSVNSAIPAVLSADGQLARSGHRLSQRRSVGWSCRERCILGNTGSA